MALVAARRPDQIVQAEPGHENAAAAAGPDVLEDEGQPQNGDIPHVEHRGARHHHVLVQPLDLVAAEVVIGKGVVVGGDLAPRAVHAGRA